MQTYIISGTIHKIFNPDFSGYQDVLVRIPKTKFIVRGKVSPQNTFFLASAATGKPIVLIGQPMWIETENGPLLDFIKVSLVQIPEPVVQPLGIFEDTIQ